MNYLAPEIEDVGIRIDVYLVDNTELTRNSIQKLIEDGNILVNENNISKNYKLKNGDEISINIPEPKETEIAPENIPLEVLYEDENLIVVNKPKNMVVHPAPGHYTGTLVNALLYHCKNSLSGINGVMRPGIVHRIDKDTSGILVAAKNDITHNGLALQLAEHTMNRIYYTVAHDNFTVDSDTITAPIGRSPYDRKKMAVLREGRHAITHFKVIERFNKRVVSNLLEVKLETGRTHQIRVHLSYVGHPVLGDTVYSNRKQPFNLDGQVLHAKVLGFNHPVENRYMEFSAPLPQSFEDVLSKLK